CGPRRCMRSVLPWSVLPTAYCPWLGPGSWELRCMGRYRLSGKPSLASEIATDVAHLTAVVEMVKQNDREPGTDLSGIAPTRRGEVTVEVSGGERVQARQRLLAHCLGITLQVGNRRFESRHLL